MGVLLIGVVYVCILLMEDEVRFGGWLEVMFLLIREVCIEICGKVKDVLIKFIVELFGGKMYFDWVMKSYDVCKCVYELMGLLFDNWLDCVLVGEELEVEGVDDENGEEGEVCLI